MKARVERKQEAKATRKEEVRHRENQQQTVNGLSSSDHKTLQTKIAFIGTKKDLNSPTVGIIIQNRLVREGGIGA